MNLKNRDVVSAVDKIAQLINQISKAEGFGAIGTHSTIITYDTNYT